MALTIPSQFFGTVASALNNRRQPEIKTTVPGPLRLGQGQKLKIK